MFVGQLDGKLVALDRVVRQSCVVDPGRALAGELLDHGRAACTIDGKVIVGFAGADRGTRGRVKAFDAKNGKLVWTFYTIPGPGEPGHETWPKDNDAWKYGGGSIWQTPAVDPELGLVYFSTGNAGPDYNGAYRAGDNLYTSSIVAVDAATGKYRWHFQQVHHDLWDYDAPNPVVLMDLSIGGRTRKALVEVGKTGLAYILDRATGEPIVGIDERPVPQEPRQATAATQPFPRGDAVVPQVVEIAPEGFELRNSGRIFTPFVGDNPTIVKPGIWGGASWPPSAYDPTSQRLFVCASSVAGAVRRRRRPELRRAGAGRTLPRRRHGAAARVPRNGNPRRARHDEQQARVALSLARPVLQRLLATGGGLLFVGRNDGRLTALDSATGKQLWEFQTGAGMNAPVSTFEYRGKQYVLAYSAGNALIGSAARRQRVAVRARRHAAAGGSRHAGAAHDRGGGAHHGCHCGGTARGERRARCRQRAAPVRADLRDLPRRRRPRRARRRGAARQARRRRGGHADRGYWPQHHAAVRGRVYARADSRCRELRRDGTRGRSAALMFLRSPAAADSVNLWRFRDLGVRCRHGAVP